MGLFGGFKAKFTKDSTAKSASKDSKKNTVVCVGYRVYSEFQDPPQYSQYEPTVRKRPPAIKTVLPRPESSQTDNGPNSPGTSTLLPIKTQIITNPKAKKPYKKSPVTRPKSNNGTEQEETNISKNVEVRNGKPRGNIRSAPSSIYVVGKTSSFNPLSNVSNTNKQKEPHKSILKSKLSIEISNPNNQLSDTNDNYIVVTNNDPEEDDNDVSSKKTTESKGYKTETISYLSASKSTPKEHTTTQVSTRADTKFARSRGQNIETNTANSYDSGGYSHGRNMSSIGNTSSHAANIFFGGDEEPEVQRPRRVNLNDAQNEEESRSSAEC